MERVSKKLRSEWSGNRSYDNESHRTAQMAGSFMPVYFQTPSSKLPPPVYVFSAFNRLESHKIRFVDNCFRSIVASPPFEKSE